MNRLYIFLLAAAAGVSGVMAQSKFNASDLQAVNHYRHALANPGAELVVPQDLPFEFNPLSRSGAPAVAAMLTLSPGYDAQDIAAYGLAVNADIDGLLVVEGSLDDLLEAVDSPAVLTAEFDREVQPALNWAREYIRIDDLHSATSTLGRAYTGAGVICGIYDQGVDPNHINFNQGSKGTVTRVQRLWHFAGTGGTFTEYNNTNVKSFKTDSDASYHGTHTLGCMAGSFNGTGGMWANTAKGGQTTPVLSTRPNPYYGPAKDADLAVCCGKLNTANIIVGMENIVKYAKSVGKPCVINLSIGSSVGPKDGTDAFGQVATKMAKDAIICVSAGNEGDSYTTLSKELGTAPVNTFLSPASLTSRYGSGKIDIWFRNNATTNKMWLAIADRTTGEVLFKHPVDLTSDSETTIASKSYPSAAYIHDDAINTAYSRGYVKATVSRNQNGNNRTNVAVAYDFYSNPTTNPDNNLMFALLTEGAPGDRVDMVNVPSASDPVALAGFGQKNWYDSTPEFSISDMACAKDVISVGSFNTRDRWGSTSKGIYGYFASNEDFAQNIVMDGYRIGQVSAFSSYGITADGRPLPTVCAPGCAIVSSTSTPYVSKTGLKNYVAYYNDTKTNRNNYWVAEQGTSMSSPVTAGVVAQMLEANPNLTTQQVWNILRWRSTQDEDFHTSGTKVQWGGGKLNAFNAVRVALDPSGVQGVVADPGKVLMTPQGDNAWEIVLPGTRSASATAYTLGGVAVAQAKADGDTVTISLGHLAPGVYIISAGNEAARVIVK